MGLGASVFHGARVAHDVLGFGLMLLASFSEGKTVHRASGRYSKATDLPRPWRTHSSALRADGTAETVTTL